jgi:hypothetical protein
MVKLAGAITEVLVLEFNQDEFIRRISNPYWFQALGCVLGYDWHSSGISTVTCGAIKESLNKLNLGIKVAGGKGNVSRRAPEEIKKFGDLFNLNESKIQRLIYSSKMSAKVDNTLIQDNYQLYHHCFIFNEKGNWVVIQQGMFDRYARRYHWLSDNIKSFVLEPHNAICSDKKEKNVLNMTAKESKEAQKISLDLVKDNPKYLEKYVKGSTQKTLTNFESFTMPPKHTIINMNKRDITMLQKAYEIQPKNYEELVAIKGIGPKTIRSLALISDLVYGESPSWRDPVKYSFTHGGKDKVPYEINKRHYDETTSILRRAIDNAKIGKKEKLYAIKRLNNYLKY